MLRVLHCRNNRLNHTSTHRLIRRCREAVLWELIELDFIREQRCSLAHAAQLKGQPWHQLTTQEMSTTIQKREAQHGPGIRQKQATGRRFR